MIVSIISAVLAISLVITLVFLIEYQKPMIFPTELPTQIEAEKATVQHTAVPETQPAPTEDPLFSIDHFIPADPVDTGGDGFYQSGNFIWNRMAFMPFFSDDNAARRYAQAMNTASEKLGSDIRVYSMIVPLHAEFGLPERFKTGENAFENTSAAEYMRTAYSAMEEPVIPVNPYNLLSGHCNEYIYFSSDHHWTGLGAYYAYSAFAQTASLPVLDLNDCKENVIEGFEGSFMKTVSADLELDAVHYWKFPYDVTDIITDTNGKDTTYDSCYFDDIFGSGEGSYLVFLMGDQPVEFLTSASEAASDEKIAVIHESYGNAFIPYLTYNYKEVYSIDFRYFKGDISDFCEEHGISNVLFLNNVLTSATASVMDLIEDLI